MLSAGSAAVQCNKGQYGGIAMQQHNAIVDKQCSNTVQWWPSAIAMQAVQ